MIVRFHTDKHGDRTAVVTRKNEDGTANLIVYMDGPSDDMWRCDLCGTVVRGFEVWVPNVAEGADHCQWSAS